MNIKNIYNCMILGDSISKGVVYDSEKSRYVTIKESFASLIESKINIKLLNEARFGNTITKGIERLERCLTKSKPDIVVIELGGNDCDFNWDEVAAYPDKEHTPNTDFTIFKKSLSNLIHKLKKNDIYPILMSIPPIDSDRYFKWISNGDSKKADGILKWLGTVNKIYWWQERYNSAIMDVAVETDTPWIDIRSAFLEQPDYRTFLCVDGIHPNPEGHKIIADRIIQFIKKYYSFLIENQTLNLSL